MNSEKLLFNAISIERVLHSFRDAFYNEMIIFNKSHLKQAENSNIKGKERGFVLKKFKARIKRFETLIKKNDKSLDCNILFKEENNNTSINKFLDDSQDFFSDIIDILFKQSEDCSKSNPKILLPAVLEENEKGNIFLNGKKYLIHTKL